MIFPRKKPIIHEPEQFAQHFPQSGVTMHIVKCRCGHFQAQSVSLSDAMQSWAEHTQVHVKALHLCAMPELSEQVEQQNRPAPLALRFDVSLSEADRKWLEGMRVSL